MHILTLDDPQTLLAWDQLVLELGIGSQLSGWRAVLDDCFSVRPHFLAAIDSGGKLAGILPMYESKSFIFGHCLTTMEGGALARSVDTTLLLLKAAIDLRNNLGIPYFEHRGPTLGGDSLPDETLVTVRSLIELPPTTAQMQSDLNKKTRWYVRQAEKHGYSIMVDNRHLSDFYPIYARRMRDLGTPVPNARFFDRMLYHLKDYILFLAVRCGDRLHGGMIVLQCGGRLESLFAAVDGAAQREAANYLLYWQAICLAIEGKNHTFDLGRSTPNSGVHRFKRKWKSRDLLTEYGYYFCQGFQPRLPIKAMRESITVKQRLWRQLPLFLSNSLGPLLRRQLPFG